MEEHKIRTELTPRVVILSVSGFIQYLFDNDNDSDITVQNDNTRSSEGTYTMGSNLTPRVVILSVSGFIQYLFDNDSDSDITVQNDNTRSSEGTYTMGSNFSISGSGTAPVLHLFFTSDGTNEPARLWSGAIGTTGSICLTPRNGSIKIIPRVSPGIIRWGIIFFVQNLLPLET